MEGRLDVIGPDGAFGWAYEDAGPGGAPLSVELRKGTLVLARACADQFREDLRPRRDGYCSFHLQLPRLHDVIGALANGGLHAVAIAGNGDEQPLSFAHNLLPASVLVSSAMLFGDRDCAAVVDDLQRLASGLIAAPYRAVFAAQLCDLLRVHFAPEQRPAEFNRVAASLAEQAGRHAAAAYYRETPRPRPPRATDARWKPVDVAASYACPRDLVLPSPGVRCEDARFVSGGSDGGYLRADGMVAASGSDDAPAMSLWLGVEGFGGSGWWRETPAGRVPAAMRLYLVDFDQVRRMADRGGVLVIDQSAEGSSAQPEFIDLLNDALVDSGLGEGQALLVTQNHAFAATACGGAARFAVATAQTYFLRGATVFTRRFPEGEAAARHVEATLEHRRNATQPRKFTCLNFTPRWVRWAVALSLFERGHMDDGFFSFPGAQSAKPTERMHPAAMLPPLARRDAMVGACEAFVANCPYVVDVDGRSGEAPDFVFPERAARESFLHIVTETEMSAGEVLRVTEKVLKPIIALQPFIVFGNERSLDLLRGMGFRTFGTVFDESYDRISSYVARFDAAERLMLDLLALETPQLAALAERAAPICIHNFLHLVFAWPVLVRHGMTGRLLRRVSAMVQAGGGPR